MNVSDTVICRYVNSHYAIIIALHISVCNSFFSHFKPTIVLNHKNTKNDTVHYEYANQCRLWSEIGISISDYPSPEISSICAQKSRTGI